MERLGRYDLRFSDGSFTGEVECKSLSADAGRKIHRKDFYRFISGIGSILGEGAVAGARAVLVITLQDRLPADARSHAELRTAAIRCLKSEATKKVEGSFFMIDWEPYTLHLAKASLVGQEAFYRVCTDAFGENCHVSGLITPDGACLIVMRSMKEDDHSKPLLEAMRKATEQLSGECPGFIALQFDDVSPPDFLKPHFRRRMGILSNALFVHYGAAHVGATYFTIYGGLTATPEGIGLPALGILNPQPRFPLEPGSVPPFLGRAIATEIMLDDGASPGA